MNAPQIIVEQAGPGITVQDQGRPGWLSRGLSRGGAVDRAALSLGAALLSQADSLAAIELMHSPLRLRLPTGARISLTGAPMRAELRDATGSLRSLGWNGSHQLPQDAKLSLSPLRDSAGFSYLSFGGGIDSPQVLGARSAHLTAGIGRALAAGDRLPLGRDPAPLTELVLPPAADPSGPIRVLPSLQTSLFSQAEMARFQTTVFHRDLRGNRMGMRLQSSGPGFGSESSLGLVSELVQPGDIQITGDGTPFVLLAECQTMGGYPRIATILPCDLARVTQAAPDAPIRFTMINHAEAGEALRADQSARATLHRRLQPRVRDPRDIPDLLAHNLIGGVISATRPQGDNPDD